MHGESDTNPDEEELLKRHKLEKKELQAKIQKLKKSVNNNKTRKKEVRDEIVDLEKNLKDRHEAELSKFRESSSNQSKTETLAKDVDSLKIEQEEELQVNSADVNGCALGDGSLYTEKKITRAEKRRQKKSTAAKERETLIQEAAELNKFSTRNVEVDKIKKILKERQLQMHEINPDGNCLYTAVAHQLGPGSSVSQLRSEVATFFRAHVEDFLPFITDPQTGDMLTPDQFEEYCSELENTAAWGGQPELRALSQILKRRIEVVQADSPPVIFGEEHDIKDQILLLYYRHYYGLGEHYNSIEPLRPADDK